MVTLTVLDIILLLTLLFFFMIGFVYGLVRAIGKIVGLVVGIWAAQQYYIGFAGFLAQYASFLKEDWLLIVSFMVIAVAVLKLVEFTFYGIERLIGILSIIPFVKTINRLLGALFVLLAGAFGLGLLIHTLGNYHISILNLDYQLESSFVAVFLSAIGEHLVPVLPFIIEKIGALLGIA